VDFLAPVMVGVQVTLLHVVVELTLTMVFNERVLALSRMWLNQNTIVRESRMNWRHQEHQGFVAIGIVTNLVELWMRR